MENPTSLSNLLAHSAIVIFLVLVALFVLRTLMLPLGVILLTAVRDGRSNDGTSDVKTSGEIPPSSMPTAPE